MYLSYLKLEFMSRVVKKNFIVPIIFSLFLVTMIPHLTYSGANPQFIKINQNVKTPQTITEMPLMKSYGFQPCDNFELDENATSLLYGLKDLLNLSFEKNEISLYSDTLKNEIYSKYPNKICNLTLFLLDVNNTMNLQLNANNIKAINLNVKDKIESLKEEYLLNDLPKLVESNKGIAPLQTPPYSESAPYLMGNTYILIIYIDTPSYKWTDSDISTAWNKVIEMRNWMTSQAPSSSNINFKQGYYRVASNTDDICFTMDCFFDWMDYAAEALGFSDTGDMAEWIKNNQSTDNSILIFQPHMDGRPYALPYPYWGTGERTTLFFYDCYFGLCFFKDYPTYAHESLHLFGAADEYYQSSDGSGCGCPTCGSPGCSQQVPYTYYTIRPYYPNANCQYCNQNSVDSVMKNPDVIKTNPSAISYYAKGMVGWGNYDNDGIIDLKDDCISVNGPSCNNGCPDTTNPSEISLLNANPSSWTSQNYATISYNAATDNCGVSGYEYQIDSTSGSWVSVGNVLSFNTQSQSTGIHTVYVRAYDNYGNRGIYKSVNIFIDTTKPVWSDNITTKSSPYTYAPNTNYGFQILWYDSINVSNVVFEFNGINYTKLTNPAVQSNANNFYWVNITDLPADNYIYGWYANDNVNNWDKTDLLTYIVDKSLNPVHLYLNNNLDQNVTIVYDIQSNATAKSVGGFVSLYKDENYVSNPDIVILAAKEAGYSYKVNATGNENYTANSSINYFLIVNKADITSKMNLSGTSPTIYGTASDWRGTKNNKGDSDCTYNLYANDKLVSNPDNTMYGAGTIKYIYNTSGCSNYTSGNKTGILLINKAPTKIDLLLNGTDDDKAYSPKGIINITVILNVSEKTVKLFSNVSAWIDQLGISQIQNITSIKTMGIYNFTGYFEGDENYTSDYETHMLTIQDMSPTIVSSVVITPNVVKPNTNITFIAAIIDNDGINYAFISGYNSSRHLTHQPQNLTNHGNNWFLTFNISDIPIGVYYFNLTTVDNIGNNLTIQTDNIIVNQNSGANDVFTSVPISTANNQTVVNASGTANTTLEITTNQSVTNASVYIATYSENPGTPNYALTALGKYIEIETTPDLKNALSWTIIKIYYTDAEVVAAGLDENTLRMEYYNKTSGTWTTYNPPFGNAPSGDVNTTGNYVRANTTHFSIWGIFGSVPTPTTTTTVLPSSGAGGGGGGGGGGGAGPQIIPCELNGVCDSWETPETCPSDCKVKTAAPTTTTLPPTQTTTPATELTTTTTTVPSNPLTGFITFVSTPLGIGMIVSIIVAVAILLIIFKIKPRIEITKKSQLPQTFLT